MWARPPTGLKLPEWQTLDNLLMQNKISTVEYLKRIPAGQITDRETLIAVLEEQERMQMAAAGIVPPQPGGQGGDAPGAADEAAPPVRAAPATGPCRGKSTRPAKCRRRDKGCLSLT